MDVLTASFWRLIPLFRWIQRSRINFDQGHHVMVGSSIANTLRLDDEDDNNGDEKPNNTNPNDVQDHQSDPSSPSAPKRGVKDDFTDITQTLTGQFWGVASFLYPPPQSDPSPPPQIPDSSNREAPDAAGIAGIHSDFAEIGGRFRRGISNLSSNVAVSEFTKIVSSFLQLESEEKMRLVLPRKWWHS